VDALSALATGGLLALKSTVLSVLVDAVLPFRAKSWAALAGMEAMTVPSLVRSLCRGRGTLPRK
jgi:hypothetical protein